MWTGQNWTFRACYQYFLTQRLLLSTHVCMRLCVYIAPNIARHVFAALSLFCPASRFDWHDLSSGLTFLVCAVGRRCSSTILVYRTMVRYTNKYLYAFRSIYIILYITHSYWSDRTVVHMWTHSCAVCGRRTERELGELPDGVECYGHFTPNRKPTHANTSTFLCASVKLAENDTPLSWVRRPRPACLACLAHWIQFIFRLGPSVPAPVWNAAC